MGRPSKYPTAESYRWLSVPAIAKEIDRTPKQTQKLLDKFAYLGLRPRQVDGAKKYPAGTVEVLKGLLGMPHRRIPSPEGDWLAIFTKG